MILPHSSAAEQALLGLIMLDNTSLDLVRDQLPDTEFYIPLYRAMFQACCRLADLNMEISPISISSQLSGSEFGDEGTLNGQLTSIFDSASRANNITTYGYIISQKAHDRRMIEMAKLLTVAVESNKPDDAKIHQEALSTAVQTFSQMSPETALSQLQSSFKKASTGGQMLKTGVHGWDEAFGGLFKGSRYIIAGHGGIGKSAFTVNLAWNMAAAGRRIRWITFEEDADALWWRVQSRFAEVSIGQFRQGLNESHKAKVADVQGELIGPDFIVYKNISSPSAIIQMCGKCDLIVIDGITSWPLPNAESKVDKAGIATEHAKTIADKTGASVILLSHVNGDGIKNGASITGLYGGQAATFDPEGIVELRFADKEATVGAWREVKMHVIKNRYGPPGIVKSFAYEGQYQRYKDLK